MKKRIISVLLALVMVISFLPTTVLAATTEVASGTCGENLTWTLDSEGTLTISGEGEMYHYGFSDAGEKVDDVAPWYEYERMDEIICIVVEHGATSIGNNAFLGCHSATSVSMPETITYIGHFAFDGCRSLTSIPIPESVIKIGSYAFSNCTSLKGVTIPNSVKSLGDGVFFVLLGLKRGQILGRCAINVCS